MLISRECEMSFYKRLVQFGLDNGLGVKERAILIRDLKKELASEGYCISHELIYDE